ncbi:hypothetical protein GQ44DRAFT_771408 [Phaeosphaeriaceae sp. PMI808]|nr:hypothetical protein GQ44DRAFT_771408 [Phaeosphaeriaceae sp. PMI808]
MAPIGARMRLTIEVLPLVVANADEAFQTDALSMFKGRKFALPVQLEDTFKNVWTLIEQRYKENYFNSQEAAVFTIGKLQDGYECDLDLRDTVGSIYESETDPTKRVIKVVPSLINRGFSIPPTSNLLPPTLQKRAREIHTERAKKRRRIEQFDDLIPDRPVPSTESRPSRGASVNHADLLGSRARSRSVRSRTGASLVFVHDTQTGHAEFAPSIKEESPELSVPPRASVRPTSSAPRPLIQTDVNQHLEAGLPESNNSAIEGVDVHAPTPQAERSQDTAPEIDIEKTAVHRSSQLTPAQSQNTPPPATTKRRDLYDIPSSPEILPHKIKSKKTYSRSPRTAATVQKEVDLLNSSRFLSWHSQQNRSVQKPTSTLSAKKAHGFKNLDIDDIESTQQEEAAPLSAPNIRAESVSHSDLTSAFLDNTGWEPVENNVNPSIQARLARFKHLRSPKSAQSVRTSSPATNGQFKDTPQSTPAKKAKPAQSTQKNTPRMSVQEPTLRKTRIKSPIPCPSNIRESTPKRNKKAGGKDTQVDESIFQKPAPIIRTSSGEPRTNGNPRNGREITSSERRNTPLRSEILLSPNVRHLSNSMQRDSATPVPGLVPPVSLPAQPKRRGRPLKKIAADSASTPATALNQSATVIEPSLGPVLEVPKSKDSVDNVIVIPSDESSSQSSNGEVDDINTAAQNLNESVNNLTKTSKLGDDEPRSQRLANSEDSLTKRPGTNGDVIARPTSEGIDNVGEHPPHDAFTSSDKLAEPAELEQIDPALLTWNAASWKFGESSQLNHDTEERPDELTLGSHTTDPSRIKLGSQIVPETALKSGPEALLATENHSDSRSVSVVASTRSSPAVLRRPARYLSHSPTSESSASEAELEKSSPTPSKAISPHPPVNNEVSESDSSDSEQSTTDDDDADIEMPDVTADTALGPFRSSPPHLQESPASTPLVPETSQPTFSQVNQPVRNTPIPLPNNITQTLGSSQTVSSQATRRKPGSRYAGFRSLREQLTDAKTTPVASQKKVYDPRMIDLGKLATKGKGKPTLGVGPGDDSSDEESSSSSSDSD